MHQKPDQMEETCWEGQNFSEVVVPQEEEDEEEEECRIPRMMRLKCYSTSFTAYNFQNLCSPDDETTDLKHVEWFR